MTDQNRKTLRSFYCRDYLWEHFEQMAQELGCSMDYLINESMRLYARSRDQSRGPSPQGASAGPSAQSDRFDVGGYDGGEAAMNHQTFDRVPAVGGNRPQQPQQPQQPAAPQGGVGLQQRGPGGPPPPPPRPGAGSPTPAAPGQNSGGGNWQQQPQQPAPPQPPGGQNFGGNPGYGQSAGRPTLHLSFNNNRYVIDKDKFVIGRGSKQTDLTIRDGNISRKHCVVIYRNGAYYIKDLGSTNGIEYRGNRIESKKIEEGDVFYLCDYELRFSHRG